MDNFSFNEIVVDVTVPIYQQMGVWGGITITDNELDIVGQLILNV